MENPFCGTITARLCKFLSTGAFLFLGFTGTSQSLSDWQNAEGKQYCASIPYSDLRSDCEGKRSDRERYCREDNSNWNGKDPRDLQKQIEDMKTGIANLKQKKSDYERELSSATEESAKNDLASKIRECDDKVADIERRMDGFKSNIEDERRAIRQAISDSEKCLEIRRDVYKIFDRVIQKAEGESDPQIKEIATRMIKEWKAGQESHQVSIVNTEKRVKNLSEMLNN